MDPHLPAVVVLRVLGERNVLIRTAYHIHDSGSWRLCYGLLDDPAHSSIASLLCVEDRLEYGTHVLIIG